MDECAGYTFAVDWWSLGVTLYEILARTRPFDIHSGTSIPHIKSLFVSQVHYPSKWSKEVIHLFSRLLCTAPGARMSSLAELRQVSVLKKMDFAMVLEKQVQPVFNPPRDHLNCDPTFELEEMIVEAKPLHKKKKRLAKQRSLKGSCSAETPESGIEGQLADFVPYNREKELMKREMEIKENEWEQELIEAMNASCTESSGQGLQVPKNSERRRSSCKLTVSQTSVQTRLAATVSRGPSNQNSSCSSAANLHSNDSVFLPRSETPQEEGRPLPNVINVPSIQIFDNA